MKIRSVKGKGEKLEFIVEETGVGFANALRRTLVSDVPTLAVETVDFQQNTSALFDEILAHRLGMIPLTFIPGKFNFPAECPCEGAGCPNCQVTLVVDRTGPCIVVSGDMKSSNKAVEATSPKFPIMELLKGQSLKFEAIAQLGTGQQHAKHQASIATYEYYPEIEEDIETEKKVNACAQHALNLVKKDITEVPKEKCDICKQNADPTSFLFRVESVSGLEPAEIVTQAAKLLETRAEEFGKVAGKL